MFSGNEPGFVNNFNLQFELNWSEHSRERKKVFQDIKISRDGDDRMGTKSTPLQKKNPRASDNPPPQLKKIPGPKINLKKPNARIHEP